MLMRNGQPLPKQPLPEGDTHPPTTIDPKILTAIDGKIDKFLEGQKDTEDRLKAIEQAQEEGRDALTARLEGIDAGLKGKDEWLEKLEKKLDTKRIGRISGSDELRNALPDDLKPWVDRVAALKGGQIFGASESGELLSRSHGVAALAQNDPVKYVAIGGWLRARIKQSVAIARGSNPAEAQKWNDYAGKLEEAMGGALPEAKAALQEDTDSEGGFLVPTILEGMIGWIMKDASVVRRAGPTVIQMTARQHDLPSLANDFTVTWEGEESTIADSGPAAPFQSGSLIAKKQAGIVTLSLELIQDNIVNLMDFVMTHLLSRAGRAEDVQILEGDGTIFTGLFSVAGTNSVAGGGNTIDETEFLKLVYGGEEQSTMDGGVIFSHPWAIRDLLLANTGSGGTPWFPMLLNQGTVRPQNIGGVPIYPTAAISRTRNTDETTLYHGNPAFIVIGDRLGTEFVVNPWAGAEFKAGQVLLRMLRRVGIIIWVPGYFTKLTAVAVVA